MRRPAQHAALMLSATLALPMLLSGCASTPISDSAQQVATARPSAGFVIAQLGYADSSYFGTCLQAACPVATPKTIAIAPQPATPSDAGWEASRPRDWFAMPEGVAVHFDPASAELRSSDTTALLQLVDQARHVARITVVGRTDNTGNGASNQRLAWQRARAVASFLREQAGVASARIWVDGRGACCYVADNATSEGRQENRRAVVTFHLAQKAFP